MSVSAAQAAAFYREVAAEQTVWTIRDDAGFAAPRNGSGDRAQPFWSKQSRAERVIKQVGAFAGFRVHEFSLDDFLVNWLPSLSRDGIRVGLNWSGKNATGYDVVPETVAYRLS